MGGEGRVEGLANVHFDCLLILFQTFFFYLLLLASVLLGFFLRTTNDVGFFFKEKKGREPYFPEICSKKSNLYRMRPQLVFF